jgi:hypothetical protein
MGGLCGMTRLDLERLSAHHQSHIKKALKHGETFKKPRADKPTGFGEEFDSQLELDYASVLENRKLQGRISEWRYHPLRFRIAQSVNYTPDFMTVREVQPLDPVAASWRGNLYTLDEVKGSWLGKNARDSRTRLQVAAYMYQWFGWRAVTRVKGEWVYEVIHSTDAEAPME